MPRNLSDALDLFLAAAADSSHWPAAMEAVADATGSYGATLVPIHGRLPVFPQSRSLEASTDSYLRDGWIDRDERYRCVPSMQTNGVSTEFDFITLEEIARHPYYQEFLAPHKLRWFAGVKMQANEDLWCLSIQRTIEQGPFSPREQEALAGFADRLTGVATLARALRFARAEGALAAFEVTDTAAALLDRRGEVLRVNSCTERLLGCGLDIVKQRLTSADPEATAALDRALHDIIWMPGAAALRRPVALPRRNMRPILAYPLRLPAITSDAFSPCQAVVLLIDLDKRARPPESVLRACFKLTAAEARLATQMAAGDELTTICETLGIRRETARAQLRAVFAKTGVHRQSELVSLLGQIARLKSSVDE